MKKILVAFLFLCFATLYSNAQTVVYSEPNREDLRQTNFEIIGRYNGNILVYKSYRNKSILGIYDADMKESERINMDFLPQKEKILSSDFIAYPDYSLMVYQYQKNKIIYCMAAKLGANGKLMGKPEQLDTTEINYSAANKLYSVVNSEDKQRIMVLKINSKNEKKYLFKTLLFDNNLQLKYISRLVLPMTDKNDFLSDFALDNQGNLVFGKGVRYNSNENIYKYFLQEKPAMADSFVTDPIKLDHITLDEVKLKVDNVNQHYVLTSFYYKGRKSNIDGIFHSVWDRNTNHETTNVAIPIGDDLRTDAKGENNIKTAFNEYYLQNIIIKKDGGFLVTAECTYTGNRGNYVPFNRWDLFSPGYGYGSLPPSYYYYNSFGTYGNPYNRWGSQVARYNADNIMVMSFDKDGKLQWSNVIRKSQYGDEYEGEASISYQLINTGDGLRFLFNDFEKRTPLLTYQIIDPQGQLSRAPVMKGLDNNYYFMPRYAKQTGQRQAIVPCLYRNLLTFAKVDF